MPQWPTEPFADVIRARGSGTAGLPQSEWKGRGEFPVIGQGEEYIEGWTDREDLAIRPAPALVLYGGHTRRAKFVDRPFVPGPNVKILEPAKTLDAKFLFYYLMQVPIKSRGYADHFPEVRRCTIPIPSLAEQKRIAAILDKADAIRRRRQETARLADTLIPSVFYEMFGTSPSSESPLGNCLQLCRNGLSVRQGELPGGLPISRIETISEAKVNPARVGYAGLGRGQVEGWLLQEGDILFSHINSLEHLGKVAIYTGQPPELVHGMNLLCLRADATQVLPLYLLYALRTSGFRARLLKYVNQSVNQVSVSTTNLRQVTIGVPPLQAQELFVARANAIRESVTHLESTSEVCNDLFNSLVQRAFRGEL